MQRTEPPRKRDGAALGRGIHGLIQKHYVYRGELPPELARAVLKEWFPDEQAEDIDHMLRVYGRFLESEYAYPVLAAKNLAVMPEKKIRFPWQIGNDQTKLVIEVDGKCPPTATEAELEKRRGKRKFTKNDTWLMGCGMLVAIAIMTVLLIAGFVLLVYGLFTRVGKKAAGRLLDGGALNLLAPGHLVDVPSGNAAVNGIPVEIVEMPASTRTAVVSVFALRSVVASCFASCRSMREARAFLRAAVLRCSAPRVIARSSSDTRSLCVAAAASLSISTS